MTSERTGVRGEAVSSVVPEPRGGNRGAQERVQSEREDQNPSIGPSENKEHGAAQDKREEEHVGDHAEDMASLPKADPLDSQPEDHGQHMAEEGPQS